MPRLGQLGRDLTRAPKSIFIGEDSRADITHGNYVQAPYENDEENALLETISEESQHHILARWNDMFDARETPYFDELRRLFQTSRLQVLYVERKSPESVEWLLELPLNNSLHLGTLAGLYRKYDMSLCGGTYHDIIMMGTTEHVVYDVNFNVNANVNVPQFESDVVVWFASLTDIGSGMANDPLERFDDNIWYIVVSYAVDCLRPITEISSGDFVLDPDGRRCQNLYLSEDLNDIFQGTAPQSPASDDEEERLASLSRPSLSSSVSESKTRSKKDSRVLDLGRLFLQIGLVIDERYSASLMRKSKADAEMARENSFPRRVMSMYKDWKSGSTRTHSERPDRLGERFAADISRSPSAPERSNRDMSGLRAMRREAAENATSPRGAPPQTSPKSARSPR